MASNLELIETSRQALSEALDFIEAHLVTPSIVELRRGRRRTVRHGGGLLECAANLEVRGKRYAARRRNRGGADVSRRVL
jgi:hypothetical protein